MYRERFFNRIMSDYKMFPRLHQQLYENGAFYVTRKDTGRARHVRLPELEESILREVEGSSRASTRSIARTAHVSKSVLRNILHE